MKTETYAELLARAEELQDREARAMLRGDMDAATSYRRCLDSMAPAIQRAYVQAAYLACTADDDDDNGPRGPQGGPGGAPTSDRPSNHVGALSGAPRGPVDDGPEIPIVMGACGGPATPDRWGHGWGPSTAVRGVEGRTPRGWDSIDTWTD